MGNKNLHDAKKNKNDEFYTMLSDVSEELYHYRKHFKGKSVFCNCDDPITSAFWKYFHLNFGLLGLTKLVSTHYERGKFSYKMTYTGGNDNDVTIGTQEFLSGNGDFRSEECIELLKEADIVVTNPPFSLFKEYISLLVEHEKKFLIIGNKNSITLKEVFPLIKENRIWLGYSSPNEFDTPEGKTKKVAGLCRWYTNLDIKKRYEKLILWETYDPKKFPKYDNYDAIDIGKTNKSGKRVGDIDLIPKDYYGVMGVPITFMDKYNPEQFEIIGRSGDLDWCKNECSFFTPCDSSHIASYKKMDKTWRIQNTYLIKNGKPYTVYSRIFIKRRVTDDNIGNKN